LACVWYVANGCRHKPTSHSAHMNLVSFLFCGFFVVLAHTWHILADLALLGVGGTGIGKCLSVSLRGWSPNLLVGRGVWNFWNLSLMRASWKSATVIFYPVFTLYRACEFRRVICKRWKKNFLYHLTLKGQTLDVCTINWESAGRMLDISNAQHVMSGWLLTHWPWLWNPNKRMQVDVEGSFVSSEQRNRLSGFWFRNYLRLGRIVYDRSAK
jgi:hypothetical protein